MFCFGAVAEAGALFDPATNVSAAAAATAAAGTTATAAGTTATLQAAASEPAGSAQHLQRQPAKCAKCAAA